jgi:hypothetical protein
MAVEMSTVLGDVPMFSGWGDEPWVDVGSGSQSNILVEEQKRDDLGTI